MFVIQATVRTHVTRCTEKNREDEIPDVFSYQYRRGEGGVTSEGDYRD